MKPNQIIDITYRGKLTEKAADIRGLRCVYLSEDARGLRIRFLDKNTGQPGKHGYFLWQNIIMIAWEEPGDVPKTTPARVN